MRTTSRTAKKPRRGVRPPEGETARTCVVTREAHIPEELVRVVVGPDGCAEVDYRARLGGRGAWILPRRDVVAQAEAQPGALRRALEADDCRTEGLLEKVRAANLVHLMDLLSLGARSGCVVSGAEQVKMGASAGGLLAFLVASDASPKSLQAARSGSLETPVFTMSLDREALGRRVGKGPRAVICIRPGGPAVALVRELRRMEELR